MGSSFDLSPYGVTGKVIYTPGHTDCSISVVLDSGHAIVGDIFIPSPYTGEVCLAYFAYSEESVLLDSVHKLLDLAHIFYGSHGGPFTKDEIVKLI